MYSGSNKKYIEWVLDVETDENKKKEYVKHYKRCGLPKRILNINGVKVDMLNFGKYFYEKTDILPLNIYPCLHEDEKFKYFKIDAWSGIRKDAEIYKTHGPSEQVYYRLFRKIKEFNDYCKSEEIDIMP